MIDCMMGHTHKPAMRESDPVPFDVYHVKRGDGDMLKYYQDRVEWS